LRRLYFWGGISLDTALHTANVSQTLPGTTLLEWKKS